MNFKQQLQAKMNEERLSSLKEKITNYRCFKVEMMPGTDVKRKWWFGYQLLGPGQEVWDELVYLGFEPKFTWGGSFAGGPGIIVRW
jgi:hypothetical protein